MAVRDGRIYSVGSDAEIRGLTNSRTRVIDAGSRRLIPGIIDAHIHVLNDFAYNSNVRWDGVPTLRQLVIRYLGYYVSTIPLGLGLIWVAFDARKQGWHDKMAGTVVVRSRRHSAPALFEGEAKK